MIAPGTYGAQPSEGGHADFAPLGRLQHDLLDYLRSRYDHVSCEWVELDAEHVTVAIEGNKAVLSGSVRSFAELAELQDTAPRPICSRSVSGAAARLVCSRWGASAANWRTPCAVLTIPL